MAEFQSALVLNLSTWITLKFELSAKKDSISTYLQIEFLITVHKDCNCQ